jgi:hypothetical protein
MLTPEQVHAAQSLYQNPTFRGFVDSMLRRKNNLSELQADRLATEDPVEGLDVAGSRRIVIDFFRGLTTAGFGRLLVGRRGKKTRFQWGRGVRMLDFAQAASSPADPHAAPRDFSRAQPGEAPTRAMESCSVGAITYRFALRRDYLACFELPADLSAAEAERLTNFIKTLPLE